MKKRATEKGPECNISDEKKYYKQKNNFDTLVKIKHCIYFVCFVFLSKCFS